MMGHIEKQSAVEATLDVSPSPSEPAARRRCPGFARGDASSQGMTSETESLLRFRLQAASTLMFVGFAAYLVWRLAFGPRIEYASNGIWYFEAAVTAVLGLMSLKLYKRCPVTMQRLRLAEVILFGLPAALFVMIQHVYMRYCAEQGYFPNLGGQWYLLLFTYALFIPNSWRRAAIVLGLLALMPVAVTLSLASRYPAVAEVLTRNNLSDQVLMMAIAGGTAIYGTYMIGNLRREAFEARRFGQYQLRELIGRGGMGEVYLAEHQLLKRPCAVKLIRPERAGDPTTLARFEREVQATAGLSHWNTVAIYDYGRTDDGTFYYVMEYLPGLSLAALVKQYGPLPAERVIHLLRQVCAGLREAHGMGLIHRDVKPGNIFAARRGGLYDVAKVLDFGLVKPVADRVGPQVTQEGTITGSPLFMAPEQAMRDQEPDARSDIYSLGGVAYFLLTGQAPFNDANPMKVLVAHARDSVTPPSELRPDVPADLEQVILRCLSKRPEERFADVASLETALSECEAAGKWTREDATAWWQRVHAEGHDAQASEIAGRSADEAPFAAEPPTHLASATMGRV